MLTTDQKGSIAEAAIAFAAIELGIGVFKPLSDGERYDLIFDFHPGIVRVQCKTAVRYGDVILVRCYSARRTADGLRRRMYTSEEVDAFAAYCADVRPATTCRSTGSRDGTPSSCGLPRRVTTNSGA